MGKFKTYNQSQQFLLPSSISEFIPEGHLARVVSEIVEELDTSVIEAKYSELGQNTYHPKILLKLLFYGYSTGVRSGRKIASKCDTDTAYMYLACMYKPDFRTINDFRKDNLEELKGYFKDVLLICKDLGMVEVGTVSIDSTKIRCNASAKRTKDKAGYEKWLARIEDEITAIIKEAEEIEKQEDQKHGDNRGDELPKELQKKQQLKEKIKSVMSHMSEEERVNLTDPDAKHIKGNGVIKPNNNCHVAVDQNGIFLATHLTNQANDSGELLAVLDQGENNVGDQIDEVLADSGYGSYANYESLEKAGKTAYIPDQTYAREQKQKHKDKDYTYDKSNFKYDPINNQYICPQGETLVLHGKTSEKDRHYKVYKGIACTQCPFKKLCTTAKARTIKRELREEIRERVIERLKTPEGQVKYKQRSCTVEAPFGHLKFNQGYRMFHLRGLQKTDGEFKLMCLTSNIQKIHKYKRAA